MGGLIIFVDSLRYEAPLAQALERHGLARRRYVPPLGYSANILPLLYGGKTPDELGFYNEYGIAVRDRARPLAMLDSFVEGVGRVRLLRKAIYRTLRTAGIDAANIPMRLVPYFTKHSASPYSTGESYPFVLEAGGFRLVLASRMAGAPPARDAAALREAELAVDRHPRVYVSLNDLDSLSHEWGLDSPEYASHEARLAAGIEELVERFRRVRGPEAPVVVLSDHGMASVHATVTLQLEERLGHPRRDWYLYFLDSTLLRLWCYDASLRGEVERYLSDLEGIGRVVTNDERREWGIVSPANGDYLFVLNEGFIFEPNFIGRGVPKAMHGYHPEHVSQHAVFLTNRPEVLRQGDLTGTDPYCAFTELFVPRGCVSAT